MTAALPAAQPPKKPPQPKAKSKKPKSNNGQPNPASGKSGDKKQKTKGKKSNSKSNQRRAKKGGEQVNGKQYGGGQYTPPRGKASQQQQPSQPEPEIYYDYDQLHEAAREFAKTLAYELGEHTRAKADEAAAKAVASAKEQVDGNWMLNSFFWVFITIIGASSGMVAKLNPTNLLPWVNTSYTSGSAGQVDVSQLDMSPARVGMTANGFQITSGYGPRTAPTAGASSWHTGVDVGAPVGTPLYAPAAGKVVCTGGGGYKYSNFTGNAAGYGPYGLEFQSADPNVPDFFAGHNSACTPGTVTPGQKIGAVGNEGVSTGPHLHLVQFDESGQHTQPAIGWVELWMGAEVPIIKGSAGNLDDNFITLAIGNAEGTRTPDGGYNASYYGHTDPGNGAANIGSFSYQVYQGGASTPEQADALQLRRLSNALTDAKAKGFNPENQAELINFLDLWNQAPRAAELFPVRLQQAKSQGLRGDAAILKARVDSFRTSSGAISASGFGHSESRLRADQQRRMDAMNRVLK